ncbi:DUF6438 domain-containing protein [Pedobacter frigidisoli]|nr:DUF6438 domain-containing protein [Pedobacter frigidisoli]
MNNFDKIFLVLLFIFSNQVFANEVDQLKTDSDVNEFVKNMNPDFAKDKYGKFKIRTTDSIAKHLSCDGIFKSWNIKNWEKADITNDGLTDLVFIAYWYDYISYALIDIGNNTFKLFRFSKSPFENCELVKPIKIGKNNYLKLYRKTSEIDTLNKQPFIYKTVVIIDTLVFKFNDFIELNKPYYVKSEIESIEINTGYCFGSCPSFNLILYKDSRANFEGIGYTKQLGKSSKRLSPEIFKELSESIQYININSLKDNYAVNWTDDQTATLTITFKDKSKKQIRDYGMQGTFGLSAIYAKLMNISTNWHTLHNYNP